MILDSDHRLDIGIMFLTPVYYRPQRSWGKVIFSQASVILLTGGWYEADTPPRSRHPPGVDTPQEQTPSGADTPPEQKPPLGADTPPRPDTPPPRYGHRAGGTHPTGMQTCSIFYLYKLVIKEKVL